MGSIFKHETRLQFTGLTFYIMSAFILLFSAIYMTVYNLNGSLAAFEHTLSGLTVVLLITVPIMTMKSIASEKRGRTDRLLYSLPLSSFEIAGGKFLSLAAAFFVPVAVMVLFPFVLSFFGDVNLLSAYSALFGFFLLGCSLLSVGLFLSSLTDNQASAAGITFIVLLLNYFLASIAGLVLGTGWGALALLSVLSLVLGVVCRIMTEKTVFSLLLYLIAQGGSIAVCLVKKEAVAAGLPGVLQSLCLFSRYNAFLNGIFDIPSAVFFLSVTVFFVFLTVQSLERQRYVAGSYGVFAGIILLAILVLANFTLSKLPSRYTMPDVTKNGMLTLSDETVKTVEGLDEEITLYWVVQTGAEDEYLKVLLERYDSLSPNIRIEKKDPDVYPTFVNKYYEGGVYNNSVAVVGKDRYRYINYSDIYTYDYSQYESTGKVNTMFSGEPAITGALSYISSGVTYTLYELNGHGETLLSDGYCRVVNNANIHIETLSIITEGAIPSDCNVLLINSPMTDLSEYEESIIKDYIKKGGSVVYISNPPPDGIELSRFEALTSDYGVQALEGIVIEEKDENYLLGTPYYLLPNIEKTDITAPIISGKYHILMPIAQGLTVDSAVNNAEITEILTTSEKSFAKLSGYMAEDFVREEGDIAGPFVIGVDIKPESGHIIRFSSAGIVDDGVNDRVAMANSSLFVNAVNSCLDKTDSLSIPSHYVKNEYLTISSRERNGVIVLIYALPLAFMAAGIIVITKRKRR